MTSFNRQQAEQNVAQANAAVVRFEEHAAVQYHDNKFNYDTVAFRQEDEERV